MAVTPKTALEPVTPSGAPARVFVSYKRSADPDESMALQIVAALQKAGYDVFIDRQMVVGLSWAEEIERQIRRADFLVVLLTAASCRSEELLGEIDKARKYHAEAGRPQMLPVRLGFLGDLPYPLNGWLDGTHYALWRGNEETSSLIGQLITAISGGTELPKTAAGQAEKPDNTPEYLAPLPRPGALEIEDPLWLARRGDQRAVKLAAQPGQTIVVKAPRQMGKTSLLYRMAQKAGEKGKHVAFIDLQLFGHELFQHAVKFYEAFAAGIAEQLDLTPPESGYWDLRISQPSACTQFMEKQVLQKVAKPVVLAIDEVDLLISSPFREDFFGMLRAWHGLRANPLKKAWKQLDLYLVTSTEPGLLIKGTQSPFNVSPPVELERFTVEHIRWLNEQYGSPLNGSELDRLLRLMGGHPYLTRLALYEISAEGGGRAPNQLFASATDETGPFGSHLRHLLLDLMNTPEVLAALREIVHGRASGDRAANYRLEALGIITFRNDRAAPSCELYEQYFRDRLG